MYVGARTSRSFARLYDKDREQKSKTLSGLWRFEVQFNEEWAPGIFEALQGADNEALLTQRIIRSWAEERGIFLPVDLGQKATLPKPLMPTTDADRQLKWLRRNVSGTVHKLCQQGYEEEVRKALFDLENHTERDPLDK